MAWVTLCTVDDLTEGVGQYAEVDGFQLAVFRLAGEITAIDSTCPHAGANLAGGSVEEGCVICPHHSWAFRLDNGQMRDSPGIAVRKYPTRVYPHEGRELVQVELPTY
jgi:nitrite reductase/ring-hydroxylating ferredoxin subunit